MGGLNRAPHVKRMAKSRRVEVPKGRGPADGVYRYRADLVRVIDGDTQVYRVDLGFDVSVTITARLVGINTPELRGASRHAGIKAKVAVMLTLKNQDLIVETQKGRKTGKYGRWLVTVWVEGGKLSVNEALVVAGHAKKAKY